MSQHYRTRARNYDCELNILFPIDLLEDLQAKASASRIGIESLILEICAATCEQSFRQIETERDCLALGLSRADLKQLMGLSEEQLDLMEAKLKENGRATTESQNNLQAMSGLCTLMRC